MIADKRKFGIGLALLAGFVVVLVFVFTPIFDGRNALDALDALYNSISKGSAYYIEDLCTEAKTYDGSEITARVAYESARRAAQATPLFQRGGATVAQTEAALEVKGDLGRILGVCLEDADDLFANEGETVKSRYGRDERQVLYTWWLSLGQMDKELKRQDAFAQAKFVSTVRTKAVECAYNYYGIVPEKISRKIPIVLFSLVFYVVYTIWYGFAILYLFEGWGMRLGH